MLGRVKQKFGWHSFRLSGILLLMAVWLAAAVPAGANNPGPEEASSQAGSAEEARPDNFTSKGEEAVAQAMAAGGTSIAEGLKCPVDMVPIQIVRVNRYKSDPVTTLSAARVSDLPPGFSAFVTNVTEHIAIKLAQKNLCLASAESQKRSLLQFVAIPVRTSGDLPLAPMPPPLEARPCDGCRISNPWIDIAIERKPVPSVRAIVRYSERQLLADQAMLAGAPNVPPLLPGASNVSPDVALTLKQSEFTHYVFEYSSEIGYKFKEVKPMEERVPPDLLWLFRRAWQSTRGPFKGSVDGAMTNAMKTGSESYTKIVIALIDRCFEFDEADIQYRDIFDVNDPILLEQYKIVTSIR